MKASIKLNAILTVRTVMLMVFWFIFFAAGIVCIILFTSSFGKGSNWTQTTGIITSLANETTLVKYDATDINGNFYKDLVNSINEWSNVWSVGQELPIKYNPSNVNEVISASITVIIIPVIGGSVFAIVGLCGMIMTIVKSGKEKGENAKIIKNYETPQGIEQDDHQVEVVSNNTQYQKKVIPHLKKDENIYYMNASNSILHRNTNFIVTNLYGKTIMESKKVNHSFLTNAHIAFYNHITQETAVHKFSGYLSQSRPKEDDAFMTPYSFKLDGQRCWKLFANQGFSISREHEEYIVIKNGEECGHIKDDIPDTKGIVSTYKRISAATNFQIICKEKDLADMFLIAVCLCYSLAARY